MGHYDVTLSQSEIERGFSVNKEAVIENLLPASLCAQRIVHNYIINSKKEIHEIDINNKMVMSCKMAHSKYTFALEEAKKTQVENEKEKKCKLIGEEIMQGKWRF